MSIRVLEGDVREKLAELPDESVHCVVTSPPYFGLRDYGTASWEGGDPACGHVGKRSIGASTLKNDGRPNPGILDGHKVPGVPYRADCPDCGATRTDKQIGLEPTPAEFVAVMVEVFREVRRVLRKDGTLWLNLGDSYASGEIGRHDANDATSGGAGITYKSLGEAQDGKRKQARLSTGLPPKNLLGIPWRVAFALQADGWYLRQDIIWAKPNPMPESVTDRCTKAHEYLFLLSKSPRYHYDAEAIREEAEYGRRDWTDANANMRRAHNVANVESKKDLPSATVSGGDPGAGRNRRSVWTVATQPFSAAHFATFPPALIEPCIRAGCPKDCCAKCGAPVMRQTEETPEYAAVKAQLRERLGLDFHMKRAGMDAVHGKGTNPATLPPKNATTGWSPSCSCAAGLVRGTVLDPFGGAGTTGLVADRLQRDAILIELNPEYAVMARARLTDDAPLFAEVT